MAPWAEALAALHHDQNLIPETHKEEAETRLLQVVL